MYSRKYINFETIPSTNDYLMAHASLFQEDMVVAVANFQTHGKGQGTHSWESEAGKNLLYSILIHPTEIPITHQFALSMAGALSIKAVLDRYTGSIMLKWPNDIYWKDKKISGTLIETKVDSRGIKNCVFGIGLNVNQQQFVSDAPNPVSLYQIIGKEINRENLLHELIDSFEKYVQQLLSSEEDIARYYHEALYRRNELHLYRDKQGTFKATLTNVMPNGHLQLLDLQGHIRIYAFKEVDFIITEK